jgi:hypothetical protein
LTNLLNSVNLPMVMVGPDLSVRRFTPQASRVLGLSSTDVGRPVTRLKLRTELDNLEQMMLDVISEVSPKQYRVRDSEGKWCNIRLTPHRTADKRIDGVVLNVLAFDDVENSPPARARASASSKRAANHEDKYAQTRVKISSNSHAATLGTSFRGYGFASAALSSLELHLFWGIATEAGGG